MGQAEEERTERSQLAQKRTTVRQMGLRRNAMRSDDTGRGSDAVQRATSSQTNRFAASFSSATGVSSSSTSSASSSSSCFSCWGSKLPMRRRRKPPRSPFPVLTVSSLRKAMCQQLRHAVKSTAHAPSPVQTLYSVDAVPCSIELP